MKKGNPDSYCGIYCGACSVFVHGETSRADGFVACLKSAPKEDIACGGCKSGAVYVGCRVCPLRACAEDKGVDHCIDCADYPCKTYGKWRSAERILPHVGEAVSSLEAIKRDGVKSWLAAQKKRWACPECGTSFSWYAEQCSTCGRKLGSKAYEMVGWRKLFCRIVLSVGYRRGKAKTPKA
jgi:hypothetical protein